MIEKKRIEIFSETYGILPVYVVCLSIISNLSLSAGIRMEACNRKRYVDNFYRHIPSALFCSEDVCFFGRVFKWYSSFYLLYFIILL